MAYLQTLPYTLHTPEGSVKLSPKEFTQAVQLYARRHNEYCDTVRTNQGLRLAAAQEWVADQRAAFARAKAAMTPQGGR